MRHALCQVFKHGDKQPSDRESSCPCYYSLIEGLGCMLFTLRIMLSEINEKHLQDQIEIERKKATSN